MISWTDNALPVANTVAIAALACLHYYKDRRLRLDVVAEIDLFRRELKDAWVSQPPILVGETFLADRLEHIDQLVVETLARVVECERKIGLNGNGDEAMPGGSE